MNVKFLHTSDFQIGMGHLGLAEEAQPRISLARIRAIDRVHEIAKAQGCRFIVVAGDFFDANSLSAQTEARVAEQLKKLSMPMVFVAGNHDPLTADTMYRKIETLPNVVVAKDSAPFEVIPGVEIVAAPLVSMQADKDLVAAALEDLPPTPTIRIAVGHGQVENRSSEEKRDQISLENVEAKLKAGVIDYLAMGDTHSTQPIGTSGRIWFSGSPEPTAFHQVATGGGEHNSGNALVVEIEKHAAEDARVEVHEHRVGEWVFEEHLAHLASMADAEAFISTLDAYENKDTTVIKYALQGVVNLQTSQYLEEALDRLSNAFASLMVHERHMDFMTEPEADEIEKLGLSGFATKALEELQAREDDTARDAAKLLLRLGRKFQ